MIRKANCADYVVMDSIFRQSTKALCSCSYSSEVIESWAGKPWPERFVQSKERGDEQYVFTVDDVVVCFGSINLQRHTLVSLFVSPQHSGKGIGQSMIEFLLARASTSGITSLSIDSSLNAVNFYMKNGFVETGRSLYKTQNEIEIESVQMILHANV